MTNTLASKDFTALLDRLFKEADAATSPGMAAMTRNERERLLHSKTEYRAFYGQIKELWLPISRQTGELLYMLARSSRARNIVEFGTSFGISTLFLAAALRDNGGGLLITTEFERSKVQRARQNLTDAGLIDLVDIREGDALATLGSALPPSIDLLLLDGAKSLYSDVLSLVEDHLRPGAIVIADDADHCPDYLHRVRLPDAGFVSMPVGDDVELSVRAA